MKYEIVRPNTEQPTRNRETNPVETRSEDSQLWPNLQKKYSLRQEGEATLDDPWAVRDGWEVVEEDVDPRILEYKKKQSTPKEGESSSKARPRKRPISEMWRKYILREEAETGDPWTVREGWEEIKENVDPQEQRNRTKKGKINKSPPSDDTSEGGSEQSINPIPRTERTRYSLRGNPKPPDRLNYA